MGNLKVPWWRGSGQERSWMSTRENGGCCHCRCLHTRHVVLLLILLTTCSILTQLGFDSSRNMTPGVFPQMVLPIESLPALCTDMSLLAGMNDKVQCQLFLSLESLEAYGANIRSLGIMTLLMACQVVLSFQASPANITNKSPLQCMTKEMLFQKIAFRIGHMTLRTAIQCRTVQCSCETYFTGFWTWLLLLRRLLLLFLFTIWRHHNIWRRGCCHCNGRCLRHFRFLLNTLGGILEKMM